MFLILAVVCILSALTVMREFPINSCSSATTKKQKQQRHGIEFILTQVTSVTFNSCMSFAFWTISLISLLLGGEINALYWLIYENVTSYSMEQFVMHLFKDL